MERSDQPFGTVAVKDIEAGSFADPQQQCDIVMKGGITSGIVYPPAILRIAQQYRFRGIGGTSAGAIAAALAAAAEFYRQTNPGDAGGAGFMRIKTDIMEWLAKGTNLRSLFVPTIVASPLYGLLLWVIGLSSARRRLTFLGAVNIGATVALALITLVGFIVAISPWPIPHLWFIAKDVAVAVVLIATIEGAIFLFVLPRSNCGMCTGGKQGTILGILQNLRTEPLTWWLSRHINAIADKPDDKPLTFGDLKGYDIDLRMITTCLTIGRPYSLPFSQDLFYFCPEELEAYFPKTVVDWMVDHPREPRMKKKHPSAADELELQQSIERHAYLKEQGYLPMPSGKDLPVVVATRLSLSFPLLMSAVKLYAVDRSLHSYKDNPTRPTIEPVWFTDGGLSSNFPISMFDAPLPEWPTMAITLEEFPPGSNENAQNEQVFLPENNKEGIGAAWLRLAPQKQKWPGTGAFYGAMVNAMQNWQDTVQSEAPGFRDRIAHVRLSSDQGGLNLTMPKAAIQALFERGELAGAKLVEQFRVPIPTGRTMTWDNHRWIRFRTSMDVMQRYAEGFTKAWRGPSPHCDDYPQLLARGETNAPSYPLEDHQRLSCAMTVHRIGRITARLSRCGYSLACGAPRPISDLRTRPRI